MMLHSPPGCNSCVVCVRAEAAGVSRVTTWLNPTSKDRTYLVNFRTHAARLREIASVLGDQDLRFGMEYVGPKTAWASQQYPFVHTMAEMKELIAEIGKPNVGIVLDSWHWYTSHEGRTEILSLRASRWCPST